MQHMFLGININQLAFIFTAKCHKVFLFLTLNISGFFLNTFMGASMRL